MHARDPVLIDVIRCAIRRDGPVTFAWFMEQALYHPEHGYYSSARCTIGRAGDYFTSVSVGPLFGRLLTAQFSEMWETLGRPGEFSLVEQGGHGGELARDILHAARKHHPEFFRAMRYRIIEPFPALELRQAAALTEFNDKVSWRKALGDLSPFRGVHFSNELIDAMPVHLVKWTGAEWTERYVTEEQGRFGWVDLPLSNPRLAEQLALSFGAVTPPAGYETEVNLAALEWMENLSQKLVEGFVIAIDYGFAREEFFAPHRTSGTLRCYAKHQIVPSPLVQIGHTDITAHVEWTSLAEQAEACGLTISGFADQHHFITGLLAGNVGEEFGPSADAKTKRALQTLLQPGLLGMKFQFLVLAHNVRDSGSLSGLRFASEARSALGMPTAARQT